MASFQIVQIVKSVNSFILPGARVRPSAANLLAELVLLETGWSVMNFGPNTPLKSFLLAVDRLRPRLVWLSVSHVQDSGAFERGCTALTRSVAESRGTLVAGGRMMTPDRRARLLHVTFGDNLTALQTVAATLR